MNAPTSASKDAAIAAPTPATTGDPSATPAGQPYETGKGCLLMLIGIAALAILSVVLATLFGDF